MPQTCATYSRRSATLLTAARYEKIHIKKPTPVPYDEAFKAFLTHTDTARDFIELHLPEELRNVCDVSALKLESGSIMEESLRAYYSDVILSLKTAADSPSRAGTDYRQGKSRELSDAISVLMKNGYKIHYIQPGKYSGVTLQGLPGY